MDFKNEENRIYYEDENGILLAEVCFPEISSNTVNITHTFVDKSLRGQGVASNLVESAAKKLRYDNKKVRLTCTYAVKWFESNPGYKDILVK